MNMGEGNPKNETGSVVWTGINTFNVPIHHHDFFLNIF